MTFILILILLLLGLGVVFYKYYTLSNDYKRSIIFEKQHILYIAKLNLCNTIMSCYKTHIMLAKYNLCNNSFLAPNYYGHFRTKDLKNMSISEIYFTYNNQCKPLFYWEDNPLRDAERDVTSQYHTLLLKGIKEENNKLNIELSKITD